MGIEIKEECPLGAICEKVKGDEIVRCRWYINVKGKEPQSEELIDQWDCTMIWLPKLLIENAQTNRGQTAAIESFRNEMVEGQNTFNGLINEALRIKQIKE